jgi:hypothetical protein
LLLDLVGVLLISRQTTVEWKPIGTSGFPPGRPHIVRALAIGPDGQSLFVATDSGVFRSDDNGGMWVPSSYGLTQPSILALATIPDRNLPIAGTDFGLFRSDDGGGELATCRR